MIITQAPLTATLFGKITSHPVWTRQQGGDALVLALKSYVRVVASNSSQQTGLFSLGSVKAVYWEKEGQGGGEVGARLAAISRANDAFCQKNSPTSMTVRVACKNGAVLHEVAGSVYGGISQVRIGKDDYLGTEQLPLSTKTAQELESHLFLAWKEEIPPELPLVTTEVTARVGHSLHALYDQAMSAAYAGKWQEFGKFLDRTWKVERENWPGLSSRPSNICYVDAQVAGAWGGCGLNPGGIPLLLVVPPDGVDRLRKALPTWNLSPVSIDYGGVRLLYYPPPGERP